MKANELRIGNLMLLFSNRVCEVIKIEGESFTVKADEISNVSVFPNMSNGIEPIPLTEEWLIKFGFVCTISNKDSGYKQYGLNKKGFDIMFSIECNYNPECFVENIGIDILYVHQLQNLYFALTNTELIWNGEK